MTVTRRILLHVTAGAILVVAIVAGVTYRFVFAAAEERTIEHLQTYVNERTRSEEAVFKLIYGNLEVVRSLFLQREARPPPPQATLDARWDRLFVHDPDGAWRSRREMGDGSTNSTFWARRGADLSPLRRYRILEAQQLTNEFIGAWAKSFPSLFMIFGGEAIAGFNTQYPSWVWAAAADFDMAGQDWYRLSTPALNPSRGFVWTGTYLDPISSIPCATVLLPIYKDGEHICTLGHDVHLSLLLDELTRSDFRGATHVVFQADGRLIMHPRLGPAILARNGELTAHESGDPALASLYRAIATRTELQFSGYEPVGGSYYSVSRVPAADWFFVTMLPRTLVREQALRSARWVWFSGLASLGLLLISFAAILRHQVGRPLAELTRVTEAMRGGDRQARATVARADDVGALAASFNAMAGEVAAREGELRQLNLDLEKRVASRTADLHEALARERELGEMKSNFVSLVSHEFRTPLGVIMSAAEVLQRYFERLTPEKRARHLDMVVRSTRNLAQLIDEVFLLGRVEEGRLHFEPVSVDLERFCRTLADEVVSATAGACAIEFRAATPLNGAVSDESVLRHIFSNLLSNAVKYSHSGGRVEFLAARQGDVVLMTVRDHGIGIPAADRPRLFTSFSRASNVGARPGTGLGLVVVKRCVELHGGTLALESEPGAGTTVTVTLPVFRSTPSPFAATTVL